MDEERKNQNGDVRDELHLPIGSDENDLGDEMNGWLGAQNNMGTVGDADAAAADPGIHTITSTSNDKMATKRGKRYRQEQIQQLEAVFRECCHPDNKVCLYLSTRLGLSVSQVKAWFQNRRSSNKHQIEQQETEVIRGQNKMLRAENEAIRAEILKSTCPACGGPISKDILEHQLLSIENARLLDELLRASAIHNKVSGQATSTPIPMSNMYGLAGDLNIDGSANTLVTDSGTPLPLRGALMDMKSFTTEGCTHGNCAAKGNTDHATPLRHIHRALEEFIMLVEQGEPMWLKTPDGELLNNQQYATILGLCPMELTLHGTRETCMVKCTASDLVCNLTDAARWREMFPGIVAGVNSYTVTASASPHGLVQLMDAKLRMLSPHIPVCKVQFVRQCQLLQPNTWAVVDVSVDGISWHDSGSTSYPNASKGDVLAKYTTCRILPSGCHIEDMNNGYCKVTWIANVEYDKNVVPPLYHPLLRSGQVFGSRRWLASLKRQSEYLLVLRSSPAFSLSNICNIPLEGRNNVLELAQHMMSRFYEAICGPMGQAWSGVDEWHGSCGMGASSFELDVRVASLHTGGNAPGKQPDFVLSASTTVWLPDISAQCVFDYLCDREHRSEWDNLAKGAPVKLEGYVATGQFPHNAVSILRPKAFGETNKNKLILQDACSDESCMLVAYSLIDEHSLKDVMHGGSHAYLPLLPSGFAILPDGHRDPHMHSIAGKSASINHKRNTGSFVSALSQVLLNGPPLENLAEKTIDNIGNRLCRIIEKIKDGIHANIGINA